MRDWIKTAKVGDKVVCINNKGRGNFRWVPGEEPNEGTIYTIADIWVDHMGGIIFEFDELRRSELACEQWGARVGYGAWRFRPVQPRRTDISVFTKLLNTAPAKESETA